MTNDCGLKQAETARGDKHLRQKLRLDGRKPWGCKNRAETRVNSFFSPSFTLPESGFIKVELRNNDIITVAKGISFKTIQGKYLIIFP